jgi:hypothetical protein
VLDENDGQVMFSEHGDGVINVLDGSVQQFLGIGVFLEELFLDIDHQQGGFHGFTPE